MAAYVTELVMVLNYEECIVTISSQLQLSTEGE